MDTNQLIIKYKLDLVFWLKKKKKKKKKKNWVVNLTVKESNIINLQELEDLCVSRELFPESVHGSMK